MFHVSFFGKGYTFCCIVIKVKLTVSLCMCTAWKGRPWNDLCCVGYGVKPYTLAHLALKVRVKWLHSVLYECPELGGWLHIMSVLGW